MDSELQKFPVVANEPVMKSFNFGFFGLRITLCKPCLSFYIACWPIRERRMLRHVYAEESSQSECLFHELFKYGTAFAATRNAVNPMIHMVIPALIMDPAPPKASLAKYSTVIPTLSTLTEELGIIPKIGKHDLVITFAMHELLDYKIGLLHTCLLLVCDKRGDDVAIICAGDRFHVAAPYGKSTIRRFRTCDICGTDDKVKLCECGIASYCSEEHQKQDWTKHKPICKQKQKQCLNNKNK